MKIHDPGNTEKADNIYVLVTVNSEGMEGIAGLHGPGGSMPLVAMHKDKPTMFSQIANELKKQKPKTKLRLIRFKRAEVMDEW